MIKLLTKIKFAFTYLKSLKYAEEGEYQKIIDTLEKYRPFIEKNLSNKFSEYYILLGESYFKVTNYRLAEGYFLSAVKQLKEDNKINKDERSYLEYYTYSFLYLTYMQLFDNIKAKQCLKIGKKINYNDEKVRTYILTHFPIDNIIKIVDLNEQ